MRKTRDARAAGLPAFKPAPPWRVGRKKRLDLAHSYPHDWRASQLRRAEIEQAILAEAEAEIEEVEA